MSMSRFLRALTIVIIVAIALYVFWVARDVFVSAFGAILLAVGINVMASWFQERGVVRGLALTLAVLVLLMAGIAILLLVMPAIIEQSRLLVETLPEYISAAILNYEALRASSPTLDDVLPATPPNFVSNTTGELTSAGLAATGRWVSNSLVIPLVSGLGAMVTIVFNLSLYFLIGLWLAIDPRSYLKALLYLTPRPKQARVREVWTILYQNLRTWLGAQLLSITITSVLVYLVLGVIMDLPYAIVIAVLAGVATLIPNIGAFIPVLPIAVFGLASDTPERTFWWLLVYLLLQLIESNLITPSIVKVELNIPAGAMMIFQLIVAIMFGPLAMLMSVPLFTIIIVLVREFYSYDMLGLKTVAPVAVAAAPAPSQPAPQSTITRPSAPGESR